MLRLNVDRIVAFQSWELFDGFPGFLLGKPQVIETLQVEPELRACAKEMSEAQCSVARDPTRYVKRNEMISLRGGAGMVFSPRTRLPRLVHKTRKWSSLGEQRRLCDYANFST